MRRESVKKEGRKPEEKTDWSLTSESLLSVFMMRFEYFGPTFILRWKSLSFPFRR